MVPLGVEIIQTGALPSLLTRLAGVGDIGLRAWWSLSSAIDDQLNLGKYDVVLFTGPPFYPMLLAGRIKSRFKVPVVLDFQDPWVSDWGAAQPKLSKRGVVHGLAKRLERVVVENCDAITSVSEVQNDQMRRRYGSFDFAMMRAIAIGGDPEDFAHVSRQRRRRTCGDSGLDPGCINVTYAGTFPPRSYVLFSVFFRAVRRLRDEAPGLVDGLRFNFVGTGNCTRESGQKFVTPIAASAGIAQMVTESSRRRPYLETMAILADSDALLLIGSDEPHYTASKIYPTLMSGRPYLSLYHGASSGHRVLSGAGGGIALSFRSPEELASMEQDILEGLKQLLSAPGQIGPADPKAYSNDAAVQVAGRFADVFDRVVAAARV